MTFPTRDPGDVTCPRPNTYLWDGCGEASVAVLPCNGLLLVLSSEENEQGEITLVLTAAAVVGWVWTEDLIGIWDSAGE